MGNIISEAWLDSFKPKDRRPLYEWAEEFITLPGVFTKNGKFSVATSRHFVAPMDALLNDRRREVNILAPPRSGKTLIADVWMPWTVANEPGSFLWIFQKDSIAKEHCELRANPILENCPMTNRLMPFDKNKKRTQEIIFSNGFPLFIWGPSINNLQSKGFRYIVQDEPWLYERGTIGEADARADDFKKLQIEKILRISQGGDVGTDWHVKFGEAELWEWSVQCAGCSKHFIPLFTGFRPDASRWGLMWDEKRREDGTRDVQKSLLTVRFECPHCAHPHIDKPRTKSEWNRTGKYERVTEQNEKKVSFHWNAIIDSPWADLVERWLNAQNQFEIGNELPRIQFIQKPLAEFYDPNKFSGQHRPIAVVLDSAWADEFMRVLTVDVQQNEFWGVVRAWAKTGESRLMWAGRMVSWGEVRAKQLEFKISDGAVIVDSGDGNRMMEIYAQCVENGHVEIVGNSEQWICWKASKGEGQKSFPFFQKNNRIDLPFRWPLGFGDPRSGKGAIGKVCPLIQFSNPTCKDILARLRDGKGAPWLAYEGVAEDWHKHIYAERRVKVWDSKGIEAGWRWENIGRRPNHLWDCEVMQVAAACMEGVLSQAIEQKEAV
jgi:phage terminase large subunit GpA-like protein